MGSFSKLTYHIVFGTKYRKPTLTNKIRERSYNYIGGIIREQSGTLLEIGGTDDHVHILAQFGSTVKISEVIQKIKGSTSRWINETFEPGIHFEWQIGYGVFTVSCSGIDQVAHYIQNQEEHHRQQPFQEEYVCLLKRHGITFEMKYLFEGEDNE